MLRSVYVTNLACIRQVANRTQNMTEDDWRWHMYDTV